ILDFHVTGVQTCALPICGLLRKFYINGKGTEHTTGFAIETWWLTDNFAYENGVPTEFYIQAVEKSTILYMTPDKQEKLLKEFPEIGRAACRERMKIELAE